MTRHLQWKGRTLATAGVPMLLVALLAYVALRSGPLAPVPVTITTVEAQPLSPALFGLGTIEARYTYRIGPTIAGRVKGVYVDVGDTIAAGQLLAEMDPVDLEERLGAQAAALERAQANVLAAEAQVRDAAARRDFAQSQAQRFDTLLRTHTVSADAAEQKRQESLVADASLAATRATLDAARREWARARAETEALRQQRANLRLAAPVPGLVVVREANPGSTLVAGQAVVEVIDPTRLWINVRFNQLDSAGLTAGLPARIALRSRNGQTLAGQVLRVEPLADAVTEELLAKVVFDALPLPLPPLGELAEVTVALPPRSALPVVPNASVRRIDGRLGVLVVENGGLRFAPVTVGATDLDGRIQILEGVTTGESVVVYSQRALSERSRIAIVERLPGGTT